MMYLKKIENIYLRYTKNKILNKRLELITKIDNKVNELQQIQIKNFDILIAILEHLKEREDKNV